MSQNQTYHKEANRKIQLIDKAKKDSGLRPN